MANDEILVIGRVRRDGGGATQPTYTTTQSMGQASADFADRFVAGWQDTSEYTSATVKVSVSNSSNLEAAKRAAENIARGLATLEAELEALPPNTPVNWDGETMTASQALNVLNTTTWVVSDQSNFSNGGVGGADHRTDTVTLNYRYFDGVIDPGHQGDYAHPNYQNDQGLVGILLHEVGHMSDLGADRDNRSRENYNLEHGSQAGYQNSDYFRNNEEFASNFAVAAANAFGMNLTGINMPYYNGTGSMDPDTLYINHMLF